METGDSTRGPLGSSQPGEGHSLRLPTAGSGGWRLGGEQRLWAIDAFRGLLAVLMALDHTNLFVAQQHSAGEYWGGPFPAYGDALPFLTRLLTHLCAPGFFFLMGTGMALLADTWRAAGRSHCMVVRHLALRGLLLVVVKLVIVNRAWELAAGGWGIRLYMGVLYGLGVDMIVGSVLLRLSSTWLLVLSLGLAVLTELVTPPPTAWYVPLSVGQRLLLVPGGDQNLWVSYPALPWLSLVALGIAFGRWLAKARGTALGWALPAGLAGLVGFALVRWVNGFGNIRLREETTWIAILNVVKYPPSLAFLLLTMGANGVILGVIARVGGLGRRLLTPLIAFGEAPLLFYVAHLYLYAVMGRLLTPGGSSLGEMYRLWLLGVVMLYPLCKWYGQAIRRQPAGSVWRLF